MFIRSLALGLASSMLLVSNVAAASQPTSDLQLLVTVTNTSHVCQRFDASGGMDMRMDEMPIPPYLQREAAPGATVTFEGLNGHFATVAANPHETADCTSKMTGVFYRYPKPVVRVKLSFDGNAFHLVKNL